MNAATVVALLHLCFTATAAVSREKSSQTEIKVKPGDTVPLQCCPSGVTQASAAWSKNGAEITFPPPQQQSPPGGRLSLHEDGILSISPVTPEDAGIYMCNCTLPRESSSQTRLLLQVERVPVTHPDCALVPSSDPTQAIFNCSWLGAVPLPTLSWSGKGPALVTANVTDSLLLTLNASQVSHGETVTCTAQHELLSPSDRRFCSLTLKLPYPEGTPLVSALEGSNINLSCSETSSIPIANTTWRKGLQQDLIRPGSKYVFSGTNPNFQLTIVNVSKEDEGIYFCRSENLLGVRELEISLTVKAASSAYTGAIIGVFLAVLILGSVGIVAKMVYLNRHRICLDGGFTQMEENGDVLSLVESDEEQFYRDAVPQLPPMSNDRQTTLVQIHRIPSSDQDDAEKNEATTQLPEDTEEATEEPEDLVVF
ncbi:V-set and immunoglobulin domain-containing protein 10 [Oryzias latipes]|uniref:V-set and immunoglobulin domain-containing protein 10 n=1 Tax=Oryzias latipes TaxID=8090 RepID=UPI0005CC6A66|nr:V-set and immunoglobulin domain-containing protein 10 [Oryzias latipes]